jgi:hypothetical protein
VGSFENIFDSKLLCVSEFFPALCTPFSWLILCVSVWEDALVL